MPLQQIREVNGAKTRAPRPSFLYWLKSRDKPNGGCRCDKRSVLA